MQRAAHGGYLGRPMHDQITLSGRDVAQSRLVLVSCLSRCGTRQAGANQPVLRRPALLHRRRAVASMVDAFLLF